MYPSPSYRFGKHSVASFALEEFETSLEAFRQAQQAAVSALGSGNGDGTGNSEDPREYRRWIRKCEAEMEAEETAELPRQDQKSVAELGGGANGGAASATPPTVAAVASRAPVSSAHVHLRTKFQYYQSYEKVQHAVLVAVQLYPWTVIIENVRVWCRVGSFGILLARACRASSLDGNILPFSCDNFTALDRSQELISDRKLCTRAQTNTSRNDRDPRVLCL